VKFVEEYKARGSWLTLLIKDTIPQEMAENAWMTYVQ
jgi:hypothetical protein